jgi:hypothetical protein
MDDDYDDEDRSEQVRSALLKALAVVVGIGVVIALGTIVVVRALGLDEEGSAGPVGAAPAQPRKPLPSTALPVPGEETEAAEPDDEDREESRATRSRRIQLAVSPVMARANERINLTGTYRGADNVGLQVQRFEEGAWRDFGVSATVRIGTYETWVMTGRPGQHRFRMWDPTAGKGSNVVLVTID